MDLALRGISTATFADAETCAFGGRKGARVLCGDGIYLRLVRLHGIIVEEQGLGVSGVVLAFCSFLAATGAADG